MDIPTMYLYFMLSYYLGEVMYQIFFANSAFDNACSGIFAAAFTGIAMLINTFISKKKGNSKKDIKEKIIKNHDKMVADHEAMKEQFRFGENAIKEGQNSIKEYMQYNQNSLQKEIQSNCNSIQKVVDKLYDVEFSKQEKITNFSASAKEIKKNIEAVQAACDKMDQLISENATLQKDNKELKERLAFLQGQIREKDLQLKKQIVQTHKNNASYDDLDL